MIKDAYELFEHPEYIHIGMDEESAEYAMREKDKVAIYRTGELLYHDIRFFVDCVQDTGAKPWMWRKVLYDNPEMYKKWFEADEILLSPFNYQAIKPTGFYRLLQPRQI